MKIELIECTPNPEQVIEVAARTCYDSADKITEGSASDFIRKLIKMGHESPLEHAYATFKISGVSRAMTHQFVRHRLMSFSQRSQRYVNERGFEYVTPITTLETYGIYRKIMVDISNAYSCLIAMGVPKEDARYVLPNACCTEIVASANFRQWRHIFKLRLDKHAQWEIREACMQMAKILFQKSTACFEEFME
jgi:thymidylate synthase (FAD)